MTTYRPTHTYKCSQNIFSSKVHSEHSTSSSQTCLFCQLPHLREWYQRPRCPLNHWITEPCPPSFPTSTRPLRLIHSHTSPKPPQFQFSHHHLTPRQMKELPRGLPLPTMQELRSYILSVLMSLSPSEWSLNSSVWLTSHLVTLPYLLPWHIFPYSTHSW